MTFVLNVLMGRVLCGFGCPVGQCSRLGDDVAVAGKTGKDRLAVQGRAIAYAVALASAIALWFVSPRVIVEGGARAVAATLGGVAALATAAHLHGRYWRWRFCEGYCPIGIYYSAVQTGRGFGIHFDAATSTCTECESCDIVCPVGLHPRDLTRPKGDIGGIAIDGFQQASHCLTCGDCVRACEHQLRRKSPALVPLRLGARVRATRPSGEKRSPGAG